MTRTLRGRVSLLALAAIAVLLVVLVVVFDVILSTRLTSQTNDTLRLRAQAASSTVQVDAGGTVTVRESNTDAALDANIWIYQAHTLVEGPTRPTRLRADADRLAGTARRYLDGRDSARLYSLPVTAGGEQVGTVVAAVSSESYEHAQHAALLGSVIVGLLLLAGSYPVLRLTASRALVPVAAMTREAADWSAHHLGQRFGSGQRYAELSSLAATLDELLDRIAAVMRHERQLAAELSHELRTPISSIGAEADLLLADHTLSAVHRAPVAAIRATATSMNEIIETLLTAARAELTTVAGVCAIEPVLRELVPEPHAVQVSSPDLTVGVDADVVRRILAPILENARRYARNGVSVTAHRRAGVIAIEVVNDGPPIPEHRAEQIFEPGFTDPAGSQDGSPHDGTGLGLALARRLARAADGDVHVEPRPSGACLRVELPPG